MAVIVSNAQRGCGTKKKGGYYLVSPTSEDGTLATAWCLGSHVDGGVNFYAERVPPRGVWTFNPAVSLVGNELVTEPGGFADYHLDQSDANDLVWRRVGGWPALIDYVGAESYSPRTFAEEVMRYGPSRRVTYDAARAVAPHLPVPIVFVAYLPFFAERDLPDFVERVAQMGETDTARAFDEAWNLDHPLDRQTESLLDALWRVPGWGLTVDDARGHAHYMARAIRWGMLDGLDGFRTTEKALFLASWITQSVWIAPTLDDAMNPPAAVVEAGIEVGVLDGTPEAAAIAALQPAL